MCGIAGLATRGATHGAKPSRELVRAMCDVIVHRGPDGEGIHIAAGVGLGMRRLAIIDLSTGDQPVANESGTVKVVFNGEIYNYRELRAELISKGHTFEAAATAKSSRISTMSTGWISSAVSTGCSPSLCGMRPVAVCCSPATGSASSRSTTACTRAICISAPR